MLQVSGQSRGQTFLDMVRVELPSAVATAIASAEMGLLPEAILGASRDQLLDELEEFLSGRVDHGKVSVTLG